MTEDKAWGDRRLRVEIEELKRRVIILESFGLKTIARALNRIALAVEKKTGGLTDAQEKELFQKLGAHVEQLKETGKK